MRRLLPALAMLACVFPATAGAATLHMSPSGSDTGSCSSAAPCKTIGRAFSVAAAGDTVAVAAGEYGSQGVGGSKSSPVVFDLDANAHFTNVTVNASSIEFRGGRIDGYGWWSGAVPSNVTFRDVTAKEVTFNGGSNIQVIGGEVGPHIVPSADPAAVVVYGWAAPLSNVVFDGVDFHDISHAVGSDHFEAMRIDGDVDGVTIRNSRFRNITANTSTIFISKIAGNGVPRNLTLENNFFAKELGGPGGGAYYNIQSHSIVNPCSTWTIRHNSFGNLPAYLGCSTRTGVSWVGNVGMGDWTCPAGNTFSHNVWQWDSTGAACSSTDKVVIGPRYSVSALGYTAPGSGDLHLTSGSPAIGAGNPASFPAVDIDGDTRPQGAAVDAGADEFRVAAPPDTTPPDTMITSGPPTETTSRSATFEFAADEPGGTFECRLDNGAWTSCTSPKEYAALTVGQHTVSVRALDAAGNADASPATRTWTVSLTCEEQLAAVTASRDAWKARAENAEGKLVDIQEILSR